jgi:hypothetical protein
MMEKKSNSEPEPRNAAGKGSEAELRRLYPHYDAKLKYMENRPFIFRYGLLRILYTAVADTLNGWRGQIKDANSPTGWRDPSETEKRQIYREEEKVRRDKRK